MQSVGRPDRRIDMLERTRALVPRARRARPASRRPPLAYASGRWMNWSRRSRQALAEVERELSDAAVSSDLQRMAQLGRRHKELSEQAALGARWRAASQGIADARGMLESEADAEMRSYLEAELASSEEALAAVEEELRLALVERDPNDERNVIIELRPGAGGDEAALFTGDIYSMLDGVCRAARLQDGDAQLDRQRPGRLPRGRRSRSRATAPTRCSSGSPACTACSACPRRSRRGGSTPRR